MANHLVPQFAGQYTSSGLRVTRPLPNNLS